jgi:superfamily II DNA or RNA helicase
MIYEKFLETKKIKTVSSGFDCDNFNPMLFDWQKDIVKWSLKKGRSCIFADCGLGKTPMQLDWAQKVHEHTSGKVLILAPLAASKQTQREGDKFGIKVHI